MTLSPATPLRIGTAGWQIPGALSDAFPMLNSNLERYAQVFDAVEINSSFHRPHRVSTYQKWASLVPGTFRFSVKVPKEITHQRKLHEVRAPLEEFLGQVAGLEGKLGPLLVQLPPSLMFAPQTADSFFGDMRDRVAGPIACEARHASWFGAEADLLLVKHGVGRVVADPAIVDKARRPGGAGSLAYARLHGSPRVYYSSYSDEAILAVLDALAASAPDGGECWCIFDNTAAGAATQNALTARQRWAGVVAG